MLEIALIKEDVAMRRYTHLSYEERAMIAHYLNNGQSLRWISRMLGRSPATIHREVRRNANKGGYVAPTAGDRYQARRARQCLLESDPGSAIENKKISPPLENTMK